MAELKPNDLKNGIEITFPDGIKEKIEFYSVGTVHCSKSKIPIKESLVVKKSPDKINFNKNEEDKYFILTTEKLKVVICKENGKISVLRLDSSVLLEESGTPELENYQ